MKKIFFYLFILTLFSCTEKQVETLPNGVIVRIKDAAPEKAKTVKLQIISDKIIRVTASPDNKLPDVKSLMSIVNADQLKTKFEVSTDSSNVTVKTSALKAIVSLKTGEVVFTDTIGNKILAEKQGGKSFYPVDIEGKKMYSVRQEFETSADEALYGLGENQNGIANIKGKDLDLTQINTIAVVPFLVSTKGYGILWDNNSRTKFSDPRDYKQISSLKLFDADQKEGGLTADYSFLGSPDKPLVSRTEQEINYNYLTDLKTLPKDIRLDTSMVTWSGFIASDTTGLHKFIWFASGYSKIWFDGKLVADKWRQAWNGNTTKLYFQMEKGQKYPIKIEWIPNGGEAYAAMKCLTPLPQSEQEEISFLSEAGKQIDYYFMYGKNMDEAISGYRTVTGKANLMPKWAMGFWQSRERYKTQDELLGVAREYRKRNIPIDNIVLDWFYWKEDKWGEQEFDSSRFPEPKAMLKELHDSNFHMMISVWPKLYTSTKNYEYMNSKGWVYKKNVENNQKDWVGHVSTFYDAYNPEAREYFWDQMNKKLFSTGVDAWWLDASEPDILSNISPADRKLLMGPTYLGSSTEYFNSFSLVNAMGVYEGQRKESPNQRVFILTRSAFAGIQRYSAASWSGDIGVRWHDMKDQIACGINFSMSGTPYWTMDIGGFSIENRYYNLNDKKNLDEWQEIMTRWYQFGSFCPLYRAHGQFPLREIYNIAGDNKTIYDALVSCNLLRYRLMPYVYSLAGQAYHNDYTIMRSLAMDFTNDKATYDINDQFMFGPSILVNPVTEYKARNRNLYLPAGNGWYDLYSGKYNEGGKTVNYTAPISNIPVFVKEGSIVPTGPEIQYAMEKSDPITLFVYTGKDGSFILYEDEGTTYDYEKGDYSIIPIRYYEAQKLLVVGARKGKFAGMEDKRTIQVVVVGKNKPVALNGKYKADKIVKYKGEEIQVTL